MSKHNGQYGLFDLEKQLDKIYQLNGCVSTPPTPSLSLGRWLILSLVLFRFPLIRQEVVHVLHPVIRHHNLTFTHRCYTPA